jgi:stage II sporulation protein D
MKKKLILMGICICAFITIFAVNIYKQLHQDVDTFTPNETVTLRDGDMISDRESLRLLGYLEISVKNLEDAIGYQDKTKDSNENNDNSENNVNNDNAETTNNNTDGSEYDSAMNTDLTTGDDTQVDLTNDNLNENVNEKNDSINDTINNSNDYLDFRECKLLLDVVIKELNLDASKVKNQLSYDIDSEPANKKVLLSEFLNLYESIIKLIPKETVPVHEKTMFVLGSPKESSNTSDDTAYKMVTDQGEFTYKNATNYDKLYSEGVLQMSNDTTTESVEDDINDQVADNNLFVLDEYIDCKISALVFGSEIIYVKDTLNEETILHNVWIINGSDNVITTFLYDVSKNFDTKYKLSGEIDEKIGDIVIKDKKIVKISIKPDMITGKVLVANEDYIEIDGYGKVNLDNDYKIYKIYDELSMEVTNSILVGYDSTNFVVADGKIVAALIKESIKAENIRVIIKTNNFESLFHQEVKLTANKEYIVSYGEEQKTYKAGKDLTFKPDDKIFKEGRVRIEPKSDSGKIELLSIKRADGTPAYRGVMELSVEKEGIVIINELPIEEYLYAVIPSEMPSYYGLEALKVQAICARSYAYNQLFANGYSQYGAHVDDSISYQVYNNVPENKDSILAVKDTYGKIIEYNKAVITAYYFSTSCGRTSSIEEVWGANAESEYLEGKLQSIYEIVDGEAVYVSAQAQDKLKPDFSKEDAFVSFLLDTDEKTYDSDYPWYRWHVTITKEDLKNSIDQKLSSRYNANPEYILTLVNGKPNKENAEYESKPVTTVGNVKDILIGKREKSGIISEIIIVGSECTIKVLTEYNIRTLLAPINDDVVRQDDTIVSNLSMLPSAYFVMAKESKNITFQGGGYGHGVGMSQNGAKAMADSGKSYEDIIKHYYTGVELGFIYE